MGTYTVGSGAGADYANFSLAETDIDDNLGGMPEGGGTIYEITGSISVADSLVDSLYLNGLTVRAKAGEECDGKGGGTAIYAERLNVATTTLPVAFENVRLRTVVTTVSSAKLSFDKCVLGESTAIDSLTLNLSIGTATNCILVDGINECVRSGSSETAFTFDQCTFVNAIDYNALRVLTTNCLALGAGTNDYLLPAVGSDYNASSDTSAPGTTVFTGRTTADLVNYGTGDYNLDLTTGSPLIGGGSGGKNIGAIIDVVAAPLTTVALTGTLTASVDETDLNFGGNTLIITLTNDTWILAGTGPIGTIAETLTIINGIVSAQAEVNGWNAERVGITEANLVRTSPTVATITLPSLGNYNITTQETITATIPGPTLEDSAIDVVATPTFTIDTILSLTGPASVTDGIAAVMTGTDLDGVLTAGLSADVGFSVTNAITGQLYASLNYVPDIGTPTIGNPVDGVPTVADVSAIGATPYVTYQWAADSVDLVKFVTTINGQAAHTTVQAMIAGADAANTTPGESLLATTIIAVEDDMQHSAPNLVDGVTITYNADGTLTTDQDKTITFDVRYWSPSTGQASLASITVKRSAIKGTLAETLEDVTSVSTGVITTTGTLAETLEDVTSAATGNVDLLLITGSGAYSYNGDAVSLLVASVLSADTSAYSYTGANVDILKDSVLSADNGTYTYAGTNVALTFSPAGSFNLSADSGAYSYSGQAVGLISERILSAESGSYVYTGQDAGISTSIFLSADSGSYDFVGSSANIVSARLLSADSGSYDYTGTVANLIFSGEPFIPTTGGVAVKGFLLDGENTLGTFTN